jgi:hypothetical protein
MLYGAASGRRGALKRSAGASNRHFADKLYRALLQFGNVPAEGRFE